MMNVIILMLFVGVGAHNLCRNSCDETFRPTLVCDFVGAPPDLFNEVFICKPNGNFTAISFFFPRGIITTVDIRDTNVTVISDGDELLTCGRVLADQSIVVNDIACPTESTSTPTTTKRTTTTIATTPTTTKRTTTTIATTTPPTSTNKPTTTTPTSTNKPTTTPPTSTNKPTTTPPTSTNKPITTTTTTTTTPPPPPVTPTTTTTTPTTTTSNKPTLTPTASSTFKEKVDKFKDAVIALGSLVIVVLTVLGAVLLRFRLAWRKWSRQLQNQSTATQMSILRPPPPQDEPGILQPPPPQDEPEPPAHQTHRYNLRSTTHV